MNRRGFFTTILFGVATFFVRRSTQAKLLLPKLEGKAIPEGLYVSQVCGRGRPVYPQNPIQTVYEKSVVEQLSFGYNQAQNRYTVDNDPAYGESFLDEHPCIRGHK